MYEVIRLTRILVRTLRCEQLRNWFEFFYNDGQANNMRKLEWDCNFRKVCGTSRFRFFEASRCYIRTLNWRKQQIKLTFDRDVDKQYEEIRQILSAVYYLNTSGCQTLLQVSIFVEVLALTPKGIVAEKFLFEAFTRRASICEILLWRSDKLWRSLIYF